MYSHDNLKEDVVSVFNNIARLMRYEPEAPDDKHLSKYDESNLRVDYTKIGQTYNVTEDFEIAQ